MPQMNSMIPRTWTLGNSSFAVNPGAIGMATGSAPAAFDKDEDGAISRDDLAAGLRDLPGLEDITNADAGGLARLYDDDGDNQISLEEFTRQLGSSGKVGEAESAVLASLRAACAKSGRKSFQEALEKRGSSVDEACLSEAMNVIGAVGTSSEQRRLVLERFGGRPSVGVITAFAKRGGVGSPDEIAQGLGEPSASPPTPPLTIMAHPALRDPALRAFADLLLAFEDDGADLAVAFRKLDTHRSGAVDARQLRSGLKSLGKTFAHFSDDDARRVVKALDKDNSGDLDLVELRKFWLIWQHWQVVSGSKLGVKFKLKTAVTGVQYVDGVAPDVADPLLPLHEGKMQYVPFCVEFYKYLGNWCAISGK